MPILERLVELVPGVRGYREREARRETDRVLREHMASRLEEARDDLNQLCIRLRGEDGLELQDAVSRLDRTLEGCVAALRYADQGYRGLFDPVKIGEPELERMYAYDETLLQAVDRLATEARALAEAPPERGPIETLARGARDLARSIARRREVFGVPGAEKE